MLNPQPLQAGETLDDQLRPVAGASVRRRDRQDACGAEARWPRSKKSNCAWSTWPKVKRTDAIQSFVSQETPIVTITDADGAVGTGYSYTIGTGGSSVMRLLADHLAPRADRPRRRLHRGDLARSANSPRMPRRSARSPRSRLRRSTRRSGICAPRSRACRCGSSPAAPGTAARSTPPKAAGCISRRRRWSMMRCRPRPRAFAAPRSRSAGRMARRISRGSSAVREAVGDGYRDHDRLQPGLCRRRGDPPRRAPAASSTSPGSRSRCRPTTSTAMSGCRARPRRRSRSANRSIRSAISANTCRRAPARSCRSMSAASAASRPGSRWRMRRRPSTSRSARIS